MEVRQWPRVATTYPVSISDHAASLHEELEAIERYVQANLSNEAIRNTLPYNLKKKISKGISLGIKKGTSNGALPPIITAQQQLMLHDTILRSVTKQSSTEARDRIPYRVFTALLDSVAELRIKVGNELALRQHSTHPTPASPPDVDHKPKRKEELKEREVGVVISSEGILSDVYPDAQALMDNFTRIENEQANLVQQMRDIRKRIKDPEIHRSENGDNKDNAGADKRNKFKGERVEEEELYEGDTLVEDDRRRRTDRIQYIDTNPVTPLREKANEVNLQSQSDSNPVFPINRKETGRVGQTSSVADGSVGHTSQGSRQNHVELIAISQDVETANESYTIMGTNAKGFFYLIIHIRYQANVNCLESMGQEDILQIVSHSLSNLQVKDQHTVSGFELTAACLIHSGDIRISLDSDTSYFPLPSNLIRVCRNKIENALAVIHKSYRIQTSPIPVRSMDLRSRRQKATTIKELATANSGRLPSLQILNGITNVDWCPENVGEQEACLDVTLSTPRQANEALDQGIQWQGRLLSCRAKEERAIVHRCSRCQSFGHRSDHGCKAPFRCGKCAGHHSTRSCASEILKCANCGRAHLVKSKQCPTRKTWKANRGPFRFHDVAGVLSYSEPDPCTKVETLNPRANILESDTNIKTEVEDMNPVVCERDQTATDMVYREPEIKIEARELSAPQDLERRIEALEVMQKRVDVLNATVQRLSKSQAPTSTAGKRSYDEALMSGALLQGHQKRTRLEQHRLTTRGKGLLDSYRPQY